MAGGYRTPESDSAFLKLRLTHPDGCAAGCSFCDLSADGGGVSTATAQPPACCEDILSQVEKDRTRLRRVCISATGQTGAFEDMLDLVDCLSRRLAIPVSVQVKANVLAMGDLSLLYSAGARSVVLLIDAAAAELAQRHSARTAADVQDSWNRNWDLLDEAAGTFEPGGAFGKLIAGLGESELEMLAAVSRIHQAGGASAIYPYLPPEGEAAAGLEPCPAGQFRRLQLASYLIAQRLAGLESMNFDEHGRVTGFGVRGGELESLVDSGQPFLATGCDGGLDCICQHPCLAVNEAGFGGFSQIPDSGQVQAVRKQLATYHEPPVPAGASPSAGQKKLPPGTA